MNVYRSHLVTDLPPGEEDAPRCQITVEELHDHRDEIAVIGRRYGVSNICVFGSVARGEADEQSDLDLLIDIAPGHGYFDGWLRPSIA